MSGVVKWVSPSNGVKGVFSLITSQVFLVRQGFIRERECARRVDIILCVEEIYA